MVSNVYFPSAAGNGKTGGDTIILYLIVVALGMVLAFFVVNEKFQDKVLNVLTPVNK